LTSLAVTDGYGLAATVVVACVIVIASILAYMIVRGETRIKRTRLGVFVERDKFDEEPDESTDIWPKDDNH
jgi:hypothetical protein